jgi:two-component system, chemotaxis family, chemotaxis protein CheY
MSKKALVVDDAPTVRLYHGEALRSVGFDVDEAANGYEALEAATGQRYDLLLVDINMPEMDGYTLVRRLRSTTVSCPIVMISTEGEEADAERAYAAGANLYLIKPVGTGHLELVAGVLTGSAS